MTTQGDKEEEFSNQSTDALQSEVDYMERSLAWTFGRAGREGEEVNMANLRPIIDRAAAMRKEIERRRHTG